MLAIERRHSAQKNRIMSLTHNSLIQHLRICTTKHKYNRINTAIPLSYRHPLLTPTHPYFITLQKTNIFVYHIHHYGVKYHHPNIISTSNILYTACNLYFKSWRHARSALLVSQLIFKGIMKKVPLHHLQIVYKQAQVIFVLYTRY